MHYLPRLLCLVVLLLQGCHDSSSGSAPAPVVLEGDWVGSWESLRDGRSGSVFVPLFEFSDTAAQGAVSITSSPCFNDYATLMLRYKPNSRDLEGSVVRSTSVFQWTLVGTISKDSKKIVLNYTVSDDPDICASGDYGTVTLRRTVVAAVVQPPVIDGVRGWIIDEEIGEVTEAVLVLR